MFSASEMREMHSVCSLYSWHLESCCLLSHTKNVLRSIMIWSMQLDPPSLRTLTAARIYLIFGPICQSVYICLNCSNRALDNTTPCPSNLDLVAWCSLLSHPLLHEKLYHTAHIAQTCLTPGNSQHQQKVYHSSEKGYHLGSPLLPYGEQIFFKTSHSQLTVDGLLRNINLVSYSVSQIVFMLK